VQRARLTAFEQHLERDHRARERQERAQEHALGKRQPERRRQKGTEAHCAQELQRPTDDRHTADAPQFGKGQLGAERKQQQGNPDLGPDLD
jgi:hypothetical protein